MVDNLYETAEERLARIVREAAEAIRQSREAIRQSRELLRKTEAAAKASRE
jgi:hypothetical protein